MKILITSLILGVLFIMFLSYLYTPKDVEVNTEAILFTLVNNMSFKEVLVGFVALVTLGVSFWRAQSMKNQVAHLGGQVDALKRQIEEQGKYNLDQKIQDSIRLLSEENTINKVGAIFKLSEIAELHVAKLPLCLEMMCFCNKWMTDRQLKDKNFFKKHKGKSDDTPWYSWRSRYNTSLPPEELLSQIVIRKVASILRHYDRVNQRCNKQVMMKFNHINLCQIDLYKTKLGKNCFFSKVNLTSAFLGKTDFTGAYFGECKLMASNFYESTLNMVKFTNANLIGAILKEASLIGADFSHAHLVGADLSNTILIGANFQYADLSGVNLSGANLSGACFYRTNIEYANLSNCTLTGTFFFETKVCRTNFTNATFQGITEHKLDSETDMKEKFKNQLQKSMKDSCSETIILDVKKYFEESKHFDSNLAKVREIVQEFEEIEELKHLKKGNEQDIINCNISIEKQNLENKPVDSNIIEKLLDEYNNTVLDSNNESFFHENFYPISLDVKETTIFPE